MTGDWVVLGQIAGLFGVRGWVKLRSFTDPRSGILDYHPLHLAGTDGWRPLTLEQGQPHGQGLLAKFIGIDDRDAAAALVGRELAIRRGQLPPTLPGEYYWTDLEGLRVITPDGVELGRVERLFETGANDVLVVTGERERLIPFVRDRVVKQIDLARGVLQVDWDPDF